MADTEYDDDIICAIPFGKQPDGSPKVYPFSPRDIDVAHLIQWGSQYGKDYGAYASFVGLFFNGDARACTCVLSLLLEKQDGVKRPPEAINFSPFELYKAIQDANEEKEKRAQEKLAAGESDPTPPPEEVTETTPDGSDQPET